MKNLVIVLVAVGLMASCTSSKEASSSKTQTKNLEVAVVKQAVEARRYVIKMRKIISQSGTSADLIPDNNFFIMNGEFASVSLPYMGRSFSIRPISGINFNGRTLEYKMQGDQEKGVYKIDVEVEANGTRFDFYLNIGSSGTCSLSVINAHIESVTYYGDLVPLSQMKGTEPQPKDRI
jgi:hypothetical protein